MNLQWVYKILFNKSQPLGKLQNLRGTKNLQIYSFCKCKRRHRIIPTKWNDLLLLLLFSSIIFT